MDDEFMGISGVGGDSYYLILSTMEIGMENNGKALGP